MITMAKKQKYYVVWHGVKPGIYTNWDACKAQVAAFPGARYKSFDTEEEAKAAFRQGYVSTPSKTPAKPVSFVGRSQIIRESISVDAACSGNPGVMEYQGVLTATGEQLFHRKFPVGTNNIGEFLAIVHALALTQKQGINTPIYSDSATAIGWVKKKKCNTKLESTPKTTELLAMVRRAEQWLAEHRWTNPLIKWETAQWGEIPADFGRKN
jgi:ribonuclease HI